MNKMWLLAICGVLIVLIAIMVWFFFPRSAAAPQIITPETLTGNIATTTASSSKSVATSTPNRPAPVLPTIAKGDSIASWDFQGAYTNNPELIAKAEAEIARLLGLIGKETYSDAILYVAVANQYELLGDGEQEYNYLSRAIKEDNETTGLSWHNLGVLMERLGAFETARVAYEKAALIQPGLKEWHYAYFEFLTTRMKDDATDIEKEFAAAIKNLGQDSDILQLYSEWENS